ncbi:Phosphoesterase HXTX, partial [mine drainage metagenome]
YFIGVVPPPEYGKQIIAFQRKWRSNRLPDIIEPHITVKSQAGLNDDMTWVDTIKTVCDSFPRFSLTLTKPDSFGVSVVYIGVESPEIYKLHSQLVEVVSPEPEISNQYFELGRFTPHLTLGLTELGMSEVELKEMKDLAGQTLLRIPTFKVEFVRVYKLNKIGYHKLKDFRLV